MEERNRGHKRITFGARTVLPVSSLFFVTSTFYLFILIYSVVVVRCALCKGNMSLLLFPATMISPLYLQVREPSLINKPVLDFDF